MESLKKIAGKYYELVDQEDFDSLLKIFSEDITYFRCEKKIQGMTEMKEFYKETRKIRGKHYIDKMMQEEDIIVVKGCFKGQSPTEEKLDVEFVDILHFNKENKINKRITYLNQGSKKIE